MNAIDSNVKLQGNESALINVLMYLDIEDIRVEDDDKSSVIIEKLGTIYNDNASGGYEKFKELHWEQNLSEADYTRMYTERQRQYNILANAAATNPHLAGMKIGNLSMKMTDPSYEVGGLEACTFTDSDGNVIVAYRGTGSGEWIDNGEAVSGFETDSEQQIEAMEYSMECKGEKHLDAKAKREMEGIKIELQNIIKELNNIASGVGAEFTGIGNEHCASGIRKVANKCKSVKRKLDNMD